MKWKQVKNFDGYYKVSDIGIVKSLKRIVKHNYGGDSVKSEKILKPIMCRGYENVRLCKNGFIYYKRVHRLVAEAFIPNPENKPQVNHKNGVKSDNRAVNLEWATARENIIHSYKTGLSKSGKLHYNYGNTSCNAIFAKCYKTGEVLSISQLSDRYKVSKVHINRMLNGKRANKTTFCKMVLKDNEDMLKEIETKLLAKLKTN